MPLAYWCVLLAAILPLVIVVFAKIGGDGDNHHPRDDVGRLSGARRRAYAAHLNAYENFPFFAAAVIIAKTQGAPPGTLNVLAALYIVLRIAHAALYIGDYATPRSVAFSLAWLSISRSSYCLCFDSSRRSVTDSLDIVPIGIEYEGAVVIGMIVRANAGSTVVSSAGRNRRVIEGIDCSAALGEDRDVKRLVEPAFTADPEIRFAVRSEAGRHRHHRSWSRVGRHQEQFLLGPERPVVPHLEATKHDRLLRRVAASFCK